MRKLFIAVISIFMVLTAANVAVLDNSKVTGYKITGETENYLELNFNVGSINYSDISTEKGAFTSVTIDGGTLTRIEGSPALPAMHELIAMPYGAEPSVEVISYDKKVYSLKELGIENPVLPAQPSYSKMTKPEDIKFIYNESSYMSSKFNDGVLAEVSKSGTMRGVGVGVLKVYPFKYNPTEGTVEVYNDLKVRVNFIGATSNAKEKAVEEYSPYFESAMAQLINYRSPALDSKADLMTYPVTYLIVAATALNGNADLNRFIAWKKQKGFNVIVNYVATTSTIFTNDAWVENQYNTLNPKPSFLLIIGDKDGTYGVMTEAPVLLGGSNVSVSDLEYGVIGTTATANRIPSIYVGRMSVRSTAELTAQVDKTLWYEKEQFEVPSPDLNYLTRTLGVAGVEAGESETHGDPQISYGWTYYFNAAHGMGNSVTYMSDTSD
ncbi:MAG: C25 family peptidase propeptide domain-containing protein, partial [Candidatus Delongbacteria bacterium]|nr:C25 family peptidase propeptide domain-containing protein [Candidatus Delongbacteria bacterium]